jgi:DNA-binding beta-propeller fold protein YncE
MRVPGAIASLAVAAAIAGCGSLPDDELPPPEGPATSGPVTALDGTLLVQVDGRRRALDVFDARTGRRTGSEPAGVGPTQVACGPTSGWCWVTDARGDALLVFDVGGGEPELRRRVYLPGRPDAIRVDRERYRLVVRLAERDEVVELPSHGRPHVVARRPAPTG